MADVDIESETALPHPGIEGHARAFEEFDHLLGVPARGALVEGAGHERPHTVDRLGAERQRRDELDRDDVLPGHGEREEISAAGERRPLPRREAPRCGRVNLRTGAHRRSPSVSEPPASTTAGSDAVASGDPG